jgi:hypothetical protein
LIVVPWQIVMAHFPNYRYFSRHLWVKNYNRRISDPLLGFASTINLTFSNELLKFSRLQMGRSLALPVVPTLPTVARPPCWPVNIFPLAMALGIIITPDQSTPPPDPGLSNQLFVSNKRTMFYCILFQRWETLGLGHLVGLG